MTDPLRKGGPEARSRQATEPSRHLAPEYSAADFIRPQIDRFCDLVMKGGVTSGVVYPLAVCRLASKYYLKNIGGTSVGAIAAVLTAAAEYRRRPREGASASGEGYLKLAGLPTFLQQDGALPALFAADRSARSYLAVALEFVGTARLTAKARNGAKKIATLFGWPLLFPLATLVVEVAFAGSRGFQLPLCLWFAFASFLALLLVLSCAATAAIFLRGCLTQLSMNHDFGWCHAHDDVAFDRATKIVESMDSAERSWLDLTPHQTPPLTDWLHGFIQEIAGRTIEDDPLTIGDLRGTKNPELGYRNLDGNGIDFLMVTTCVTLGRPFTIPFNEYDSIPGLSFRAHELRSFFPARVVKFLEDRGGTNPDHDRFYLFPKCEDIPLLVAARMSMSFPILFCALPLYAPDKDKVMRRLWFSDGGLTSNFPIHFFDSPLPRWPTFAIDLLGGDPAKKDKRWKATSEDNYVAGAVFMEDNLNDREGDELNGGPEKPSAGPSNTVNPWERFDGLVAFLMAIVDTMRTWQDSTLGTLLANTSRTVGIRLSDNEGGLNLTMPKELVADLIERGDRAANVLLERFSNEKQGWEFHGWVRYRTTMAELSRWVETFHRTYREATGPCLDYPKMISTSIRNTALEQSLKSWESLFWGSQPVANANLAATAKIDRLANCCIRSDGSQADFRTGEPNPQASLRTRPPF